MAEITEKDLLEQVRKVQQEANNEVSNQNEETNIENNKEIED